MKLQDQLALHANPMLLQPQRTSFITARKRLEPISEQQPQGISAAAQTNYVNVVSPKRIFNYGPIRSVQQQKNDTTYSNRINQMVTLNVNNIVKDHQRAASSEQQHPQEECELRQPQENTPLFDDLDSEEEKAQKVKAANDSDSDYSDDFVVDFESVPLIQTKQEPKFYQQSGSSPTFGSHNYVPKQSRGFQVVSAFSKPTTKLPVIKI